MKALLEIKEIAKNDTVFALPDDMTRLILAMEEEDEEKSITFARKC